MYRNTTAPNDLQIQCNHYQNFNSSLHRSGKNSLKCVQKHIIPQIAQTELTKKDKAGDITPPDFKIHYKALVIKTVWYWHINRHISQYNNRKGLIAFFRYKIESWFPLNSEQIRTHYNIMTYMAITIHPMISSQYYKYFKMCHVFFHHWSSEACVTSKGVTFSDRCLPLVTQQMLPW